MTYYRRLAAQIERFGREITVYKRAETGTNEFGNVTDDHVADRAVLGVRTYPNRNTQVESRSGDRDQDRPVFIVPQNGDQRDPPSPADRIEFDGQMYDVKSHTEYETHVEFFGEPVIHN